MTIGDETPDLSLDLWIPPDRATLYRVARVHGVTQQLSMARVEKLKRILANLRKQESQVLKARLHVMTTGYSRWNKQRLIMGILYCQYEIKHFDETGTITVGKVSL